MKRALLALAVLIFPSTSIAQWPMNAGVYDLAKYVKRSHCDANGKNCDLYPAFQAALAACKTLREKQFGATFPGIGCTFEVPEGWHRLSQTVQLCRDHVIEGRGDWGPYSNTMIFSDSTAFWARAFEYCDNADEGLGGNATFRGFGLILSVAGQANQYPGGCTTAAQDCGKFGILANARISVENFSARAFTQNIRINADVGFADSSIASMWRIDRAWLTEAAHASFFVQGNDASAGQMSNSNLESGCSDAATWSTRNIGYTPSPQNDCACVMDVSFLGNVYTSIHTQGCIDTVAGPDVPHPAFHIMGALNPGVCLGCYTEANSALSEADAPVTVIGGTGFWLDDFVSAGGKGLKIFGNILTPFAVTNKADTNNRVLIGVGTLAGYAIAAYPMHGGVSPANALFQLRYDLGRQTWHMGASDTEGVYNRAITLAADATSSDGTFVGQLRLSCTYWTDPDAADECTP